MASPFRIFRKYMKTLLVVFGVMLMFVFVIGDALQGYLGGGPRGGADPKYDPQAVAVKWDGGSLTNNELNELTTRRRIAKAFVMNVLIEGQRDAYLAGVEPRPLRVEPIFLQNTPEKPQDGVERSVVQTRLFADAARKAGMKISDESIVQYLDELGSGNVSRTDMRSMLPEGVSIDYIIAALREEMLARNYITSHQFAWETITPQQRWDDWLTVNDRVVIEAAAMPAESFITEVDNPSDADLARFYEEHKDRVPMPEAIGQLELPSATPGFAIPRKVDAQFIEADYDEYLTKLEAEVTDEEIAKYYEENKELFIKADTGLIDSTEEKPVEGEPGKQESTTDPSTTPPAETPPSETTPPAETAPAEPATEPAPPTDGKAAEEPTDNDETPTAPEQPPAETEPQAPPTGEATPPADEAAPARKKAINRRVARPWDETFSASRISCKKTKQASHRHPLRKHRQPKHPLAKCLQRKRRRPKLHPPNNQPLRQPTAPQAEPPAPTAEQPAPTSETPPADPTAAPAAIAPPALGPQPPAKPVEYQPLEEVKDLIRRELAERRTADKLAELMNEVNRELDTEYSRYVLSSEDRAKPPAGLANLAPIAEKHGLKHGSTGLVSMLELRDLPVGRSGSPTTGQPLWYALFEDSDMALYQPQPTIDLDGNRFIVVKMAESPGRVPKLDEIKEEVIKAWKLQRAAEFAQKCAEELAKEANSAAVPLAEFFANQQPAREVVRTDPFSHYTGGDVSLIGTQRQQQPFRLSQPEGIVAAGPEFLDKVFELKQGEVGAIMNNDRSIAYVVRLAEHQESPEELHTAFLSEANLWPGARLMVNAHAREAATQLVNNLTTGANLKWERPPDQVERDEAEAEGKEEQSDAG